MDRALDTTAEADRVQFELWSRMSASERSTRALGLSRVLLEVSRALIDAANPRATQSELIELYVAAQYGEDLAVKVRLQLDKTRAAGR